MLISRKTNFSVDTTSPLMEAATVREWGEYEEHEEWSRLKTLRGFRARLIAF